MEDILEERRRTSDLRHVLQRQNPPKLECSVERTPPEISDDVLHSPRLRAVILKISRQFERSVDDVTKEAQEILREMAHARSMKWIRTSGFFLSKVMKSLFESVNVNSDRVEEIRPLLTKYPVIFMPSHRSYMDFLLLSFVLFQYSLPCPVICAAQDFLNMKFFANVIRHCGGFFIRRSFASDKLYWNIFSEFVQTHVLNGDFPLEFFIEGTRSRTGKSLLPKLGMLSTAMECVIRGRIPDVVLVPIAVSFDRVLEESLYAHELLGIPKPKESASGLFKARSILSENYGSIHVKFGEPVFAKDVLTDFGVDRSTYNLQPRMNEPLSPSEMKACSRLGLEVLLRQQDLFVVSPFCVVAALLLQSPAEGCALEFVERKTREISFLARQLGLTIDDADDELSSSSSSSSSSLLDRHLRLHADSVELAGEGGDCRLRPKIVESSAESSVFDSRLLAHASKMVQLSIYRNQMLHFFVDASLVVRILASSSVSDGGGGGSLSWNVLSARHARLRRLLKPEFLFADEALPTLLRSAVDVLAANSVVTLSSFVSDSIVDDGGVSTTSISLNGDHPLSDFLDRLLLPFIQAYYLSFRYHLDAALCAPLNDAKSNAKLCQGRILRFLLDRGSAQFDMLSLDTLTNASSTLVLNDLGVRKSTTSQHLDLVDSARLEEAAEFLRSFVPPEFSLTAAADLRTDIPKSKL